MTDEFIIFFYVVKECVERLGMVGVYKVNHSGFVKDAPGFFVVKRLKGREVVGDGIAASIVQDYFGDVVEGICVF